eukprot:4868420-Pyramimonas_sp.AAC.1
MVKRLNTMLVASAISHVAGLSTAIVANTTDAIASAPPARSVDTTGTWACTSISASSFVYQYNSYRSGNTMVVTNTANSAVGRVYYTTAVSGGFR